MTLTRGGWGLAFVAAVVGCGAKSGGDPTLATDPTPPAPIPAANGTLEPWQSLTPLTTARANHCSVVVNGFLVVIGGNYKPKGATSFVDLDDVLVAKLTNDGTVGSWSRAGKTPSAVNSCTAATDGTSIYLVDGIFAADDPANPGPHKVRRAALGTDGSLAPWQDLGALPDGVRVLYSSATVNGGALRAFHSRLPEEGDAISLMSASVAGPALGTWQESSWLKGFRGHPAYVFADLGAGGAFVYSLGGYGNADTSNAVLADCAGAALDAAGAPGPSFSVSPLPKPTSFGQAVAVDTWVFSIGGKDSVLTGSGSPDVYAAPIQADGRLGTWTSVAKLPQGRTSHAVAQSGDYLYVTGGGFDAGGLDTVFSARVRFTK